ncbi:hypothetical protein Poli38472_000712 [Pythium oligandrum]|uniref:Uncharacterized protein n=1 Tax=Pythium oligandrum TaxID=41045 RepID=A0A8K1CCM0_PYTOL|nr:hypothetical protein Poli38472_000712 [Pythium oligandrum]|eukprot:TMW60670.1 hypothetical protein Poli38472_000712 [Pythium oligandrum]
MADTTTSNTTNALLQNELTAVQRRYHGQVLPSTEDGVTQVRCFVSLSDPDLPTQFKGEAELMVTLPADYPASAARLDLCGWEQRMSKTQFRVLNEATTARAEELRGVYGLRKLLTWLDNNFYRLLQSVKEEEEEAVVVQEEQKADKAEDDSDAKNESTEEAKDSRRRRRCPFFARGKCNRGAKCKFAHTTKQPAATDKEVDSRDASHTETQSAKSEETPSKPDADKKKKKKKQKKTDEDKGADKPEPAVTKKTKRPCKFFAKGKCRDGDQCKFSHEKKTKNASEETPRPAKPAPGILVAVIGEPTSPKQTAASVEVEYLPLDPKEWTTEQQKALDTALMKYPTTMDKKERWTSIASEVNGKTLNDCIDRFKLLCQLAKSGHLSEMPETPPPAPVEVTAKEEDSPSEEAQLNAKIIPVDQRVPVETEPEVKGTQIRLDELFMHQVGTLTPHRLVCQVQCSNCPLKFDAKLSLADAKLQKWCPRCSALHVVSLRPVFAHAASDVVAYIDSDNCAVVDVLPSDLLASCLDCSTEALVESTVPGRRSEQACFSCHTKLAVMTKRFVVTHLSTSNNGVVSKTSSAPATTKKTSKRPTETFVLGQPLPRNGVCEHYKHSFRWFRFQCCGKAFPCDVCHDSSDCPQANTGKIASKTVCGYCSKEQSSSVKECSCGNTMGKKVIKSSHWEGGQGCRDRSRMSANDKAKYRGVNKTESQKSKRVGQEGKARAQGHHRAHPETVE